MKYPHIYKMLKTAGHSPNAALRVIIDARRGDRSARDWIVILFMAR